MFKEVNENLYPARTRKKGLSRPGNREARASLIINKLFCKKRRETTQSNGDDKALSFYFACSSMYTNTWAVQMVCNESCVMLEGLARKHGLENLSQVGRNLSVFITLVKEVVESRS